jgi:TetR/AcrR family tetracycline transcriptional repressor
VGRRAGREPLTRGQILGAALRLVDEQGMDGLSMRRLAAELKVDPMAIYYHVPGKQAITAGLVQMVFAELRVPSGSDAGSEAAWQDRVREWAGAYRNLARSHANLVLHLVSNPAASTVARLEAEEALYSALADAGLSPTEIVGAADLLVDFLNGVALAESTGVIDEASDDHDLLAHLRERPAGELPTLRRVHEALAAPGARLDSFDFGLIVLINGIEAIAARGTLQEPG